METAKKLVSSQDDSGACGCHGNQISTTDGLLRFLYKYQWLYDFKVTEIFTGCIWKSIPQEWLKTLEGLSQDELVSIPDGQYKDSWPESLNSFIKTSQKYSLKREISHQSLNSDRSKMGEQEKDCGCSSDTQLSFQHNTEKFTSPHDNQQLTPMHDYEKCSDLAGGEQLPPLVALEVSEQLSSLNTTGQLSPLDVNAHLPPLDVSEQVSILDIAQHLSPLDVSAEFSPLDVIFNLSPLDPSDIGQSIRRGMSAKKLHEVCHMSSLVAMVTEQTGCDVIVDIGAGLGYLGQVLHHNYGLPVLGIEGQGNHTAGAEQRATHSESCPFLQNITCRITPDEQSLEELSTMLVDWFTNLPPQACTHMTGFQSAKHQMENSGLAKRHQDVNSEPSNIVECNRTKKCFGKSSVCGNAVTIGLKGVAHSELLVKNTEHMSDDFSNNETEEKNSNEKPEAESSSTEKPNTAFECQCFNCDTKCDKQHIEVGNNNVDIICDCCNHGNVSTESTCYRHGNRKPRVCMIGLHCCGDLTPTILRYFARTDWITSLCCVSCCYHRMEYSEVEKCHHNFPMSCSLGRQLQAFQKNHPKFRLSPFAMRLAAQETRSRWRHQSSEDHSFHTRNVAYRALLEVCLLTGDFSLSKTSRKLVPRSSYESIDSYSTAVFRHLLVSESVTSQEALQMFKETMATLHDNHVKYFCLIEPITALQFLLQPVLESVVYLDRQIWLAENGCHGNIVPVFDEFISPRNLALVAMEPSAQPRKTARKFVS